MRGVSSLSVGITAGREPVARMIRSKLQRLFAAVSFFHPQSIRVFKSGSAANELYFALLGQQTQPAGKLIDHAFFKRAQAGDINFRLGEFDPPSSWRGAIR